MNVTETPSAIQDLMDNAEERELWITGRLFEHAPYFHAGKGGDTRLTEALRMCLDDKITPQSDGSYQVQGSGGRVYRVAESCSCPASQHAKSRWCKHAVGVAVYVEWQRRLHPAAPVALGTLRAGTLPLPPTTVDERLAQPAEDMSQIEAQRLATEAQGDVMADNEYIHEPDDHDAPVAILERPTPSPLPGPVLLPSLDAQSLKRSMQEWSAQRQVIRSFLQQELKEGVDFYRLQVRGKDANPTLSKAGAEKFLGLFQLQASFMPDIGTWEMLGKPHDLVCYVCTLMTRHGEVVGEGRGARSLKKDGGDANKAIKMSEKSALIDAVLRTGALSEVYTQDLESDEEPAKAAPAPPTTPAKPSAQEYRQRIWAMVQAQAPEVRTREAVEARIKAETGYDLHPDNYFSIIKTLEQRA